MFFNQSIKHNQFHGFFSSLSSIKGFLFVLSFITFLAFPILACIPILLLLQIRVSQKFIRNSSLDKKIKISIYDEFSFISLFLILFATTIFMSTNNVRSDVLHYLNLFSSLKDKNISDFFSSFAPDGDFPLIEPMAFFIPHIVGMFLGHSDGLFLLIQSFTFNFVNIFFAYRFFPLFCPTIILINITSYYYFSSLLTLRQAYSVIFLLCMLLIPFIIPNIIFLILSLLTHRSSINYALPLILLSIINLQELNFIRFRIFRYFQNFFSLVLRKRKLVLAFAIIFLPGINVLMTYYTNLSDANLTKMEVYTTVYSADNIPFVDIALNILPEYIFLIIILTFFSYKIFSSKNYIENSCFIVAITSLLMMTFVYSSGLNSVFLRGVFFWSIVKGFFYPILFLSIENIKYRNKKLSRFLFLCLIFLIGFNVFRYFIFNSLAITFVYLDNYALDKWMASIFPVPRSGLYMFFSYANDFTNNDIPTVANNLFDYLLRFYHLIESVVTGDYLRPPSPFD